MHIPSGSTASDLRPGARRQRLRRAVPGLLLLLLALLLVPAPAGAAYPSPRPSNEPAQARYQGQVTRIAPGKKRIALTFDGDAFGGRTGEIIDDLYRYHAKATFFLTGHYMETYPTRSRGLVNSGQEVASHGYKHLDYRDLSDGGIARQLAAWEATYSWLTGGKHGPPIWRAPYGYSTNRVRVVAADSGYRTIYWTLDALDTVGAPKSANFIFNRLTRPAINLDGAILLLHVNPPGTIDALPRVLANLQARGLKMVTVSELLAP
jgi:peptidoglycan/xylan/chitin deacetylase (PgdA/CDA1 family)